MCYMSGPRAQSCGTVQKLNIYIENSGIFKTMNDGHVLFPVYIYMKVPS